MTLHMLDTNIVSDAVRNPHGPVLKRIAGPSDLAISAIVAAELRSGMEKREAMVQLARLQALLSTLVVLPFDVKAAAAYARVRAALERRGQLIGANDMLIAAHALALGATLVTDDGDFSRVEGLAVENWLRG